MNEDNLNREIFNKIGSNKDILSFFQPDTASYDREIVDLRLELIRRYGRHRKVLDLCCGTGSYLIPNLSLFAEAIGVDFSKRMINTFLQKLNREIPQNLVLITGEARQLPVRSNSIDFIFSFASLYYIPEVNKVIQEVGRVLRPGGMAVFELGNFWSLNTYVCKVAHRRQGIAKPFHISYSEMLRFIKLADLAIAEERVFQILPMWGGPRWLFPLVTGRWKRLMGIKLGNKMLDEYISGFGPFRYLAFRHLFVCRKN